MKKLALILATSCLFVPAAAMSKEQPMSGFYAGVDTGVAITKVEGFAETLPPIYEAEKRTDIDLDDTYFEIGGQLGYGYYFDNSFFLGAEISVSKLLGGTDELIENTAINHEVEVDYSTRYDVSGLVGVAVGDKGLVYGRLGYGRSDINVSPRDTGGTGGAFHDLSGPIFGGGYAHAISDSLDLRLDVSHFSVDDSYNNDKNDGEIYDIGIKDTRARLGLIYRF